MAEGSVAADQLRLLIERIERLEEEKKAIADDIKDVYAEAKARGFDTKALREIVRLRKMTAEERREREAIVDTYRAALGMLDGTPLGKWAVDRLKKPEERQAEEPPAGADSGKPADKKSKKAEPPAPADAAAAEPELTIEDARRMGREAAQAGQSITSNPFPAFDDRRAAWDEEWCGALGTDGMDIPDALKRREKPKKGDDRPDGDA